MDNSSRRDFLKSAATAVLAANSRSNAAPAATLPVKNRLEPFLYTGVRLREGRLQRQFEHARNLYRNISDDSLLLGFRQRAGLPAPGKPLAGWYGGDPSRQDRFSPGDVYNAFGQYLSGMARLAKAANDPDLRAKASHLVEEWAKTIEPDGYFYYSRHPHTPHYIYEKMCCGLVDLREFGSDANAMRQLERITAWAVRNLDRSRKTPLDGCNRSANGQEWYTLPENLYRAWQVSGNPQFRDFAGLWHYPAYWGIFTGKSKLQPWGFHAYSHVNTLSSAAMTYAVTGDAEYLRTIVNAFDWLERTQLYPSGGFGPDENIMQPNGSLGRSLETSHENFETVCGSWAGFKLARYLMMFTGEAKYGDWIERLLYNGIGAALPMQPDGTNFYYSDYQLGGCRKDYHPQWKWSCCSGTYPQAIADYHNVIYFRDQDGIYVNLYVPSEVEWARESGSVRIVQETDFPEADTATLKIQPAAAGEFALRFRIPRWCEGAGITVNGAAQTLPCKPGTWAELRRSWKAGDEVTLRFPMRMTAAAIDPQHPRRIAFVYGPVLLVRKRGAGIRAAGEDAAGSLRPADGPLQFVLSQQEREPFVPFYRLRRRETYDTFFDLEA